MAAVSDFIMMLDSTDNTVVYSVKDDGIKLSVRTAIDINVGEFLGISENIFTYNGKNAHELILFYNVDINDSDYKEKYHIIDDNYKKINTNYAKSYKKKIKFIFF